MSRPLFDSEFIFGIHEEGGEHHMLEAGRPGWVLFTEGVGHDRDNHAGRDYRHYSDQGLGIIVRLNNGYHPQGTIPTSDRYDQFAQRCANFVANSPGCKIWIIGNEMNYDIERPRYSAQGGPASSHAPMPAPPPPPPSPPPSPPKKRAWWQSMWANLRRLFKRGASSDSGAHASVVEPAPPKPLVAPPIPSPTAAAGAKTAISNSPDELDPLLRSNPQRFSALTAYWREKMDDDGAIPPLPDDATPLPSPPPPAPMSDVNRDVEVIPPALYARCYTLCRDAIRALPGHEDDQVLVGAVAPWNNQTAYAGNPDGDWVQYMQDILAIVGPDGSDGITLHTYTHDCDTDLIFATAKMNPPFQHRHFQFRAYRDFMQGIPESMRHLPVYITEADQDVAWQDRNIGWIQRAYGEINYWNQQPGNQQIRALILYRWPQRDKWYIEGKHGLIEDFKQALQNDYRWQDVRPEPAEYEVDDLLEMLNVVNVRRTPGYVEQADDDLIASLPIHARVQVLDRDWVDADGLTWWQVCVCELRLQIVDVAPIDEVCWVAQYSPVGAPLVARIETPMLAADGKLGIASVVKTAGFVKLRKSAGYLRKPGDDVVANLAPDTKWVITDGPRKQDGIDWWSVRSADDENDVRVGWLSETTPSGLPLLVGIGELVGRPTLAGGDEHSDVDPPTAAERNEYDGNGQIAPGHMVKAMVYVRFRHSPGYRGKPANDVIADLPPDTLGEVLAGPQVKDDLTWWQLDMPTPDGARAKGWAAEADPNGASLLAAVGPALVETELVEPEPSAEPPVAPAPVVANAGRFHAGNLIAAAGNVRVRRSPGYVGKADDDTLGAFDPTTVLNVVGGPVDADDLTWWRVGGICVPVGELIGWVAECAPSGMELIAHIPKLPGTDIPDLKTGACLAMPFRGVFAISQLWGERPHIYSRFHYDGTPLRGHNGIDFYTPMGTPVQAVDDGVVVYAVDLDQTGLGAYVLLRHAWGESIYAHMDWLDVKTGQSVTRAQSLGRSGSSGNSDGPHLHFAIRINPYARTDGWGGYSDPLPYLPRAQVLLPAYVLPLEQRPPLPAGAPAPIDTPMSDLFAPGMAPDQPGVRRP